MGGFMLMAFIECVICIKMCTLAYDIHINMHLWLWYGMVSKIQKKIYNNNNLVLTFFNITTYNFYS